MAEQTRPQLQKKVKDLVFTNMFQNPKYLRQLYVALHPEDTDIQPEQLEVFTVTSILAKQRFNDLGFLAKDRFMVLVEAQSTKNFNIPLRMLIYAGLEYSKYITENKLRVFGEKSVHIPKPELYVVYTGKGDSGQEIMRFSETFFPGEKDIPIEVSVRVLYGQPESKDILSQYVRFAKTRDEFVVKYKGVDDLARKLVDYCVEHDILREYLTEHRSEVITMLDPVFTQEFATETYEAELREEGRAEERESVAVKMIRRNKPLSEIMDFCEMTAAAIANLAKQIGAPVPV